MDGRFIVLYDRRGVVLSCSPKPRKEWRDEFVGRTPDGTMTLAEAKRWRAAFKQALAGNEVVWEGNDTRVGRWRSWLYPVRVPPVAVVCESRLFPPHTCSLTPRERTICIELARGKTSKQIAHDLGVVRSTIDNHRHRLSHKLGIHPSALPGWCGIHAEWLS